MTTAIGRLQRLIDLKMGKPVPPRPGDQTAVEEKWLFEVNCDRKEIFEDDLATCRTRLVSPAGGEICQRPDPLGAGLYRSLQGHRTRR